MPEYPIIVTVHVQLLYFLNVLFYKQKCYNTNFSLVTSFVDFMAYKAFKISMYEAHAFKTKCSDKHL